jgi:hypothetical protein
MGQTMKILSLPVISKMMGGSLSNRALIELLPAVLWKGKYQK